MMTYSQLSELAKQFGFSAFSPLDTQTIKLNPEVRAMCASNTCGQYGRRWSCPPGCGTLEECEARLQPFSTGILVQSIGDVEDSFDFEAMTEIETMHKARFRKMYACLRAQTSDVLAIGSGCCTSCAECTYPNAPCRFPEEMYLSMEAYGILVSEVCKANNLPYYYGSGRIAFTGCFLIAGPDA